MASSIKKQVISLFIGKFMSMLILILLPVVLVRLMEKLDYGLYQQGILIINSVGAIFAFGISSSFYYFFNIINIKEKKQLIWQSGFLLLMLAIISSFILIFFNEYLSLIVSNVEILQLVLPIGLSVFFFILSDPIEHLLIVEKKYRNKGVSHFLMKLNDQVIKKNNKISFLICSNNLIRFYKRFGWRIMPKKIFSIVDHSFDSNGMYFNSKVLNKNKYIFFFYK